MTPATCNLHTEVAIPVAKCAGLEGTWKSSQHFQQAAIRLQEVRKSSLCGKKPTGNYVASKHSSRNGRELMSNDEGAGSANLTTRHNEVGWASLGCQSRDSRRLRDNWHPRQLAVMNWRYREGSAAMLRSLFGLVARKRVSPDQRICWRRQPEPSKRFLGQLTIQDGCFMPHSIPPSRCRGCCTLPFPLRPCSVRARFLLDTARNV